MQDVELSAVVPVYNEVENVAALHEELSVALKAIGRPYEIIFVDDGSSDGTVAALLALRQGDPQLRIVKLARNYGQTAAMAAGSQPLPIPCTGRFRKVFFARSYSGSPMPNTPNG